MYRKKIDMRGIMKQLENTLSASAFAEAGEYETARQLIKTDQRVLLVLTGTIGDAKSLKYAENFCERMKAKLEVICSAGMRDSIEVSLRSIREKGIEYTVAETDACLKQAIVDITLANKDIRYVVVNSFSDLEVGCSGDLNTKTDVRDMVRCPLVVVGA
jgi:hypothetical protein